MASSFNIVFASDERFVGQLSVASFSVIYACKSSSNEIIIHILDCGIGDEAWADYSKSLTRFAVKYKVGICLKRHRINMSFFDKYPSWTNGSKAAWSRLLLPDILTDVDTCIYSDCDVLFIDNPVSILDGLSQTSSWMVGHRNPYGKIGPDGQWFEKNHLFYDEDNYLCSGLIGMNLAALRKEKFTTKFSDFVVKYNPSAVDQVVLNWFCYGRTAVLEDGWGTFPHECYSLRGELHAIHYSGGYPWSITKNVYDWICQHCSHELNDLWIDFRNRIVCLEKKNYNVVKNDFALLGMLLLIVSRVLNVFGATIPKHPCFSEMVKQYSGNGEAICRAKEKLFYA